MSSNAATSSFKTKSHRPSEVDGMVRTKLVASRVRLPFFIGTGIGLAAFGIALGIGITVMGRGCDNTAMVGDRKSVATREYSLQNDAGHGSQPLGLRNRVVDSKAANHF
ncbi:hypothetical protein CONLIGDRAFT_679709 [Coniochaeta ligniaria NRRL 30616]|uniref:Uncharacterized protein n=1 Tax=Coniochaeta ligniaria NRRL 30616 TaxID=1408157 RepID=A0A1J7ITF4_9PEZI|nr:hypothetical protein CONLIGDRAFT_679709 [Coniochaeta ligniaria NRRL 30616]